jgi:mono/diheme cytochrome c family protein
MRSWMFGLVIGLAACGGETTRVDAVLALDGDAAAGASVYADNCAACHGASGLGVDDPDNTSLIGDNLTEAAGEVEEDAEFARLILDGEGSMPSFADGLDDQQIADVLAYMHDGLIQ